MNDISLNDFLKMCKNAAAGGYKIAVGYGQALSSTLLDARKNIEESIAKLDDSLFISSDTNGMLKSQLANIKNDYKELSEAFEKDLKGLRKNLSKFSVTLFGRTMAGKSTLMEILTEGDGASIGIGSQRTTRDVRKYEWNGLEITDVPGIGAFEGEEDEQIAFEAAKTADMILFLITDDAPQAVEAECFSRVVALGKPVICVMNVKATLTEQTSAKRAEQNINEGFDMNRLGAIRSEFLNYADGLGQSWEHIPFVYVHLKAAFMAHRVDDEESAALYYQLSRIDELKAKIIDVVREKGQLLRVKTFVDIVSNPVLDAVQNLLEHSGGNRAQCKTIQAKISKVESWRRKFENDSKSKIKSFIEKIKSELDCEISTFAEEHCCDENADKTWKEILKNKKIEDRCKEQLEILDADISDYLSEISREISNELKFTSNIEEDKILRMKKLRDVKKGVKWGTVAVGGGLSIGAIVAGVLGAACAGPLGWVALGVTVVGSVVSFLFKSRAKKEAEARRRLENNLRTNINEMCSKLQKNMLRTLEDSLLKGRIDSFLRQINGVNSSVLKLAIEQSALARGLNKHYLELNLQFFAQVLTLIGADELMSSVQRVARLPGKALLLELGADQAFPLEQRERLQSLMGEQIRVVYETEDELKLISDIIGSPIDYYSVSVEKNSRVARIKCESMTPEIVNRARLAQQIAGLHILKQ